MTSAYSYDLRCVKSSGGHYNWAKYIAVALLPPTAFFIVVITLPPMVALVHILQFIVYPQKTRVTTFVLVSIPVRILYTIYGVWNHDFFRTVILPEVVCLEMSTIQMIVLALDYLVALYRV